MVDSHPRFVNVIFAFVVIEVVVSWVKENAPVHPVGREGQPDTPSTL